MMRTLWYGQSEVSYTMYVTSMNIITYLKVKKSSQEIQLFNSYEFAVSSFLAVQCSVAMNTLSALF